MLERKKYLVLLRVVVAETVRNRRNQIKGVPLSLHSDAPRPRQAATQENANDAIFKGRRLSL